MSGGRGAGGGLGVGRRFKGWGGRVGWRVDKDEGGWGVGRRVKGWGGRVGRRVKGWRERVGWRVKGSVAELASSSKSEAMLHQDGGDRVWQIRAGKGSVHAQIDRYMTWTWARGAYPECTRGLINVDT